MVADETHGVPRLDPYIHVVLVLSEKKELRGLLKTRLMLEVSGSENPISFLSA